MDWIMLDRNSGSERGRVASVIMAEHLASHGPWPVAYNRKSGEVIYYLPHNGFRN